MAKVGKGDYLSCEICGLSLIVDESNAYGRAEVVCCDFPMASGKASAARARKRAKILRARIEEKKIEQDVKDKKAASAGKKIITSSDEQENTTG